MVYSSPVECPCPTHTAHHVFTAPDWCHAVSSMLTCNRLLECLLLMPMLKGPPLPPYVHICILPTSLLCHPWPQAHNQCMVCTPWMQHLCICPTACASLIGAGACKPGSGQWECYGNAHACALQGRLQVYVCAWAVQLLVHHCLPAWYKQQSVYHGPAHGRWRVNFEMLQVTTQLKLQWLFMCVRFLQLSVTMMFDCNDGPAHAYWSWWLQTSLLHCATSGSTDTVTSQTALPRQFNPGTGMYCDAHMGCELTSACSHHWAHKSTTLKRADGLSYPVRTCYKCSAALVIPSLIHMVRVWSSLTMQNCTS